MTFNFKEGESLKKLELTELEKFGFDNPTSTNAERRLFRRLFCIGEVFRNSNPINISINITLHQNKTYHNIKEECICKLYPITELRQ